MNVIHDNKKLQKIYNNAKDFLIIKMQSIVDNPENLLNGYLITENNNQEIRDMSDIFERILFSAQNANMKANVIGGSIGGVSNLGKVLCDFEPKKVLDNFDNSEQLLDEIFDKLQPKGKQRREPNSIWTKYCHTILQTAKFLSQFKDKHDFYQWINFFYQDNRSKPALPMILSKEIYGLGYALACDFLKELGFVDYGKPDVHIKDIFVGIGLCDKKSSDYAIQKIMIEIAKANKVSVYNVDKIFWLIGSGNFYKDKGVDIKSQKKEFIEKYHKFLKVRDDI